jgi:hypothetical protein
MNQSMPRKRTEKTKVLQKLERTVSEVLVARDNSLKPFVHSFQHEPENVTLRPLGTLLGVFEVEDRSKDSAYVVNFLASVAKKEYFAHPKRPAIESLEAALHKVNLALSELIKHDNTAWLGTLNAAVFVLEKHNLHFSVAGRTKTLLLRSGALTDISDGLAEESEPHPLKTFTEVASGRLKAEDKVIAATPGVFDILSTEEIQRNAQRLSQERFVQFVRTALINQLPVGGALIVDMFEKTEVLPEPAKPSRNLKETLPAMNAFSQTAFAAAKASAAKPEPPTPSHAERAAEPSDRAQEEETEYTDAKTGHIYVQGQTPGRSDNERWHHIRWTVEERLWQAWESLRKTALRYRKNFQVLARGQQAKAFRAARRAAETAATAFRQASDKAAVRLRDVRLSLQEAARKRQEKPEETETVRSRGTKGIPVRVVAEQEQILPIPDTGQAVQSTRQAETFPDTVETSPFRRYEATVSHASAAAVRISGTFRSAIAAIGKEGPTLVSRSWRHVRPLASRLLPRLSNAKTRFARLSPRHKAYAVAALVAMVALPLLWSSPGSPEAPSPSVAIEESRAVPVPARALPEPEQDVRIVKAVAPLARTGRPSGLVLLKRVPYLVTDKAVVSLENTSAPQSFPLPAGSGNVSRAAAMDDLNTVFILTDSGKLFAFTPSNRAFAENKISLPHPDAVEALATYLTYLYVADSQDNMIYRFPRTEGGFSAPIAWLKETATVGKGATLAINENVYLAGTDKVLSLDKGKQDTFALPDKLNPLSVTQIFTAPDTQHVYILDAPHKRVIEAGKNGSPVTQYINDQLSQALAFAVDESAKTVYFSTASGAFSFSLE